MRSNSPAPALAHGGACHGEGCAAAGRATASPSSFMSTAESRGKSIFPAMSEDFRRRLHLGDHRGESLQLLRLSWRRLCHRWRGRVVSRDSGHRREHARERRPRSGARRRRRHQPRSFRARRVLAQRRAVEIGDPAVRPTRGRVHRGRRRRPGGDEAAGRRAARRRFDLRGDPGWGLASDGRAGIMQPVANQQAAAIRRAVARAGVQVTELNFVEGHGTGTRAGDRTEIEGLSLAMADACDAEAPVARRCGIGSLKSLIGHTARRPRVSLR